MKALLGGDGVRKKKLTAQERRFCLFYVMSGSEKEAAAKAGFDKPQETGICMLYREDIAAEIKRLFNVRRDTLCGRVCTGYERLAFGSIADAIRLMYSDNPASEPLDGYDLFCVSEIKRMKDNTMEIKFSDRLKALEKLEQLGREDVSGASSFYQALAACSDKDAEETEVMK